MPALCVVLLGAALLAAGGCEAKPGFGTPAVVQVGMPLDEARSVLQAWRAERGAIQRRLLLAPNPNAVQKAIFYRLRDGALLAVVAERGADGHGFVVAALAIEPKSPRGRPRTRIESAANVERPDEIDLSTHWR